MKKFKNLAIILLIAALLIASTALIVSAKNSPTKEEPFSPAHVIGEDEKAAFEAAVAENSKLDKVTVSYLNGSTENASVAKIICYGKYEDCIVWFSPTMLCVLSEKAVCGLPFRHSSSFVLNVYADGQIYKLDEAYENKLISEESIKEIYELHKSLETDVYKSDLYKDPVVTADTSIYITDEMMNSVLELAGKDNIEICKEKRKEWYDELRTVPDLMACFSYGTIDEYTLFHFKPYGMYDGFVNEVEYEGYVFGSGEICEFAEGGLFIWVYKDGKSIPLMTALKEGIISAKDANTIVNSRK